MESGADKSVMGMQQTQDFSRVTGRKEILKKIPLMFRFGDGERVSQGTLEVIIYLPDGQNVAVQVRLF